MAHPYQMCIMVSEPDPNHPEWPVKKIYFDASPWLKQKERYIKVNDFALIDLEHQPFDSVGSSIYWEIAEAVEAQLGSFPELKIFVTLKSSVKTALETDNNEYFMEANNDLDSIFERRGSPTVEYLYTEFYTAYPFKDESIIPLYDFFLLSFSYQEREYEVYLRRKPHNSEITPYTHLVYKIQPKGEWKEQNPKVLTYERYLEKVENSEQS